MQFFGGGQSVADLKVAGVGDADYVAGECLRAVHFYRPPI